MHSMYVHVRLSHTAKKVIGMDQKSHMRIQSNGQK